MKGSILDFSTETNSGIISGENDTRYNFTSSQWQGQNPPNRGDNVEFNVDEEGNAIQILTTSNHTSFSQQVNSAPFTPPATNFQNPNLQPEQQFNMFDWFVKCLKNYATFTGRARRKEFWFFTLVYMLGMIVTIIIDQVIGTIALFTAVWVLGLTIPSISVAVRRLHDTNRTGWFYLIQMVPLVGPIILLIWLATETIPENNKWGSPAK